MVIVMKTQLMGCELVKWKVKQLISQESSMINSWDYSHLKFPTSSSGLTANTQSFLRHQGSASASGRLNPEQNQTEQQ